MKRINYMDHVSNMIPDASIGDYLEHSMSDSLYDNIAVILEDALRNNIYFNLARKLENEKNK